MRSLERRLQLGMALSVLVVFAVLLAGGTLAVRKLTEAYVYTRLAHDAEALLAALRPLPGGGLQLREGRISPVYAQPLSGHYFVVLAGDAAAVRSRSLWDEGLAVEPRRAGETWRGHLPGPAGQDLLVYSAGFARADHAVTILVAEDVTPLGRQIRAFQGATAGAFLAVLLGLLYAQRRVVRGALRQLDGLRRDVREVAGGERRALREAVPNEVRPLVQEFNRLLALLEQRLERSRNAVGNLAHALKTPLSLLTGELERPQLPDRDLLLDQTARIRQLVERELRRARIAGAGAPGLRFAPREEVPALFESLRRLHRDRRLQLQAQELPRGQLPVDREDMLELLGNLLDNACKWAATRVHLALTQDRGAVRVVVEDDGAGVPDGELARLTGRGTRIDESAAGHGLGLAIVGDIVKVYGGTLAFERSPELGGLRVGVRLPRDRSTGAP